LMMRSSENRATCLTTFFSAVVKFASDTFLRRVLVTCGYRKVDPPEIYAF
jgi:hypothetical protein